MFKIDWTMCSKYANQIRLNSEHDWGHLYDYFNELKDLHFDIKENTHMSSEIYEANGYMHDLWIC